jgi:multiple sugar transport system substrate-binding protein
MFSKSLQRLGVTAMLAISSASFAQAETTLEVLHAWPGDHGNYEPLAEAFMRAHPDIKIKFRVSPPDYNEAQLVVTRNAMTGGLPDVYFSGYSFLRPLVATLEERGQAVKLKQFIDAEPAGWMDENYSPAVLSLAQVDNVQYGLPFNASTPIVYYNADLVKKAGGDPNNFPTDWNGVIQLAKRIGEVGDGIQGMDFSVGSITSDWNWQATILERGGSMLSADDKSVGYNNELGLEALKFLRSVAVETTMKVASTPDPYRQLFFAGKLGLFITSPSAVRQYAETIGDRFEMRTAKYPVADKGKGRLPTGGNAAMILSQDEDKQKAAWEFVKFVTSADSQAQIARKTGYMPTNIKASELLKDFYASNPNYRAAADQMNRSAPWFAYPGTNGVEIWRKQREILTNVQNGTITPEAGLEQISSATAELLK